MRQSFDLDACGHADAQTDDARLTMTIARSAMDHGAVVANWCPVVAITKDDGGPIGGMLAIVHTVLFWAGNAVLTPLILLATLFLDRKRTVHDLLLGTVVVHQQPQQY